MPRLCEPCRFHSSDDSVSDCPQCGGPVKFTLLPPPNAGQTTATATATAAPPAPPRSTSSGRVGLSDLFRGKLLYISVGVIAAVFVAVLALWLLRGDSFEQKVAKVKVGMSMPEAMRIMGDDNKPKKKAKVNFTVGPNGVQETPDRFSDFDEPIDVWGEGSVEYVDGFDAVVIEYRNGVVTGVTPKKREGGMRKKTTVYYN